MAALIDAFQDIVADYDVILCDVWGVLHNGVTPFMPASHALAAARKAGRTVVLITNSPRPRPGVIAQLDAIGVPAAAYDRIVTSGDVTRDLIAAGPKRIFLLGPERDLPLVEGLDVDLVSAGEAESLVCTGLFDDETETPEDYRDMLLAMRDRNVPMICANPDLIVERGDRLIPCAGALAVYYEQLGGTTRVAGKPHRPIYDAALAAARELRGDVDPARILAIGDGLPTDVRGALDYGLDLLYIGGGIHAAEYTVNGVMDDALVNDWLKRENAAPKYWMPKLA
ncbi:TIGR01459 family HAD-type hydrolase [Rhizobiaceae bacterium BDR2-2]|uniref:TIGR01459 family HAD-type hydrolase n=1 Tax=Ectorhizobium quercum TaxID=2965071 RepID=A0AAE3SU51_9HYPH|nr:TIGR01459 family HAD-type hydrolase [Ectorhizobium quercum]MCX8996293.1 TIGR01459 family HAD-type hydrolase [Ectorhizobium quercum]MCX8998668.1 TIGR01459 family HAD-type hydrolase [Ectorhizobium quercum]